MKYKSIYQKGNESTRHYMLKQISKYIAWDRGYKIMAEEVNMLSVNELGKKNIADLVAVKKQGTKYTSICIEAKQSRADYKNGFVSSADLNYIIAPKGLLKVEDILKGVGLIEIDFDELRIYFDYGNIQIVGGINTVIRASRKHENKYKTYKWNSCDELIKSIAYKNTVEMLYNRHGIFEDNEEKIG